MAWTTTDIPDLTGKVAVVTGANGGLGFETTKALATAGAHVVMAARDQAKADAAVSDLRRTNRDAPLEIVPLDLGDLEGTAAASEAITSAHPIIDILVNNAGLMAMPERRTADGFEMQFGVNHLGHWALTARLLPSLIAADAARIVTVTSTAHHFGRSVDPDNVNMEGEYSAWGAYCRSKLANFHFAIGLQRVLADRRVSAQSLVAHPGLSNTNLQSHAVQQGGAGSIGAFFMPLAKRTGMSAADGALPQLRAATDPGARGGEILAPRFTNFGSPVRRPILRRIGIDDAIDTLWMVSERETGLAIDVSDAAV